MISIHSITFAVLIIFFATTEGFTVIPSNAVRSSTSLNIFGDALKNAFASDDSLGKAKDAGLSGVSPGCCLY